MTSLNQGHGSSRQTEALVSVIYFVFVVYSHHKYPKYRGGELNHGHCIHVQYTQSELSRLYALFIIQFFMDIASVIIFSRYDSVNRKMAEEISTVYRLM